MPKRPRIPRHTKEELNAVAVAAQTGDQDALEELRTMMRPYQVAFVRKLDQTRYTQDESFEIDQAAWLGILEALKRFDPEAGAKFSTYAHHWMRHEVSEWLARNSGALPMPRTAWNFGAKLEEVVQADDDTASPHELPDEDLASLPISVVRKGEEVNITIPYAGDIFRARKSSFDLDPTLDLRHSPSAEDDFFGEETFTRRPGVSTAQEDAALIFIESLGELDPSEWEDAADAFVIDQGFDLDIVEGLIEAASLLHGETP